MAKFQQGPFGEIKGKLGNYMVTTRNGQDIVQKLPTQSGEFTDKQVDAQIKFAMAAEFYRPLRELVMVSFRKRKTSNGANMANGHFISHAVSGSSPDIIVDFSKVAVSRGTLRPAYKAAATNEGNSIHFTWEDNSILGEANELDGAVVVVHCPERGESFFMLNLATRNAGKISVDAGIFGGHDVHAWLAFMAPDKKKSSDSVYLGKMALPGG